jgi:hypothetical protein
MMHFLKKYKKADNENDACFLMYLVKAMEKHLEILQHVQKPVIGGTDYKKKSVILKLSPLKKLYKLLNSFKGRSYKDLTCANTYLQ